MAGKRVLRRSGVGAEHSPGALNPIPAPIEKWAQARPVRPGAQIKEMSGIAADRQQPRSSGSGTVFRLCSRPVKVAQPIDGEASPALDRRLARLHLADRFSRHAQLVGELLLRPTQRLADRPHLVRLHDRPFFIKLHLSPPPVVAGGGGFRLADVHFDTEAHPPNPEPEGQCHLSFLSVVCQRARAYPVAV